MPGDSARPSSDDDSDLPLITGSNTRVRASNAMHRARIAAVRGALASITAHGVRQLTMVDAADRGGLARATLYNHVRDKEELLALVLEHETTIVADAFIGARSAVDGLIAAGELVANHPALAAVRSFDPAVIADLAACEGPGIRDLAARCLTTRRRDASEANVDLVLRWLGSLIVSPGDAETRRTQATAIARLLG